MVRRIYAPRVFLRTAQPSNPFYLRTLGVATRRQGAASVRLGIRIGIGRGVQVVREKQGGNKSQLVSSFLPTGYAFELRNFLPSFSQVLKLLPLELQPVLPQHLRHLPD